MESIFQEKMNQSICVFALCLLICLPNVLCIVSSCSAPISKNLLYNVDKYTAASVGLPNGSANESLSEAICCDVSYRNYSEPNGFFKFPDVRLFQVIDSKSVTTFYDSVCGLPLFQAPIGRPFADWKEDTTEHGLKSLIHLVFPCLFN